MGTIVDSLNRALSTGRYLQAANLLRELTLSTGELAVAALEALYYLGESERTRREGARLLESAHLAPGQAARAALITAAQFCDDGEEEAGINTYQKALDIATKANDRTCICLATTQLLERTCDYAAFDASLPLASLTRRTAISCGEPQVTATVHLTFGRLEGRAGRWDTARRHFAISRELLLAAPNLRLSASVDSDEGVLLTTLGDFEGALQLFQRAAALSAESGWSKGIAATAANAGCILTARSRFVEAEKQLRIAERQPFKSPAVHIAMAETRAQMAMRSGDLELAADILSTCDSHKATGGAWYQLIRQAANAQLRLRRREWSEALAIANSGLEQANQLGALSQATPLLVAKAEALCGLGQKHLAHEVLLGVDRQTLTTSLLGSYSAAIAKALHKEDDYRGRRFVLRAINIFEATGNTTAEGDAREILLEYGTDGTPTEQCRGLDGIDTAIGMFELAAHLPSLAREVTARLCEAQCTLGSAVTATDKGTVRVVSNIGWDERQILAALKNRDGIETITLGQYRDESWQVVTRTRPEVHHRSTFIAIKKLLAAAVELERYRREDNQRAALWPAEALDNDPESIWASEQMAEVLKIARRIAPTPSLTILLTGETGTGKEMLARAIHRASDRADKTLLPFNCTAVPKDMLESQLFGFRKGSFTGADASFQGVIRSAAGGTLFLDEIAEIPLDVQPKLLRFLETHEIHPLGEPQPIKVDVRIVAATNGNLEQLVAEGKFREDLFYRLNVVRLKLPPLRERREEIPALVEHYLRKFGDEQKKGRLTLADETLEYLLLYAWPGNVRQLANEVRRMVAMAEADSTLTPALLSPEIQASRRTIPAAGAPPTDPEIRVRLDQPLPAAVEMLEQTMIRSALMKSRGRVEEAAKLLGISRKGLFLKRRRWNLDQRQAS